MVRALVNKITNSPKLNRIYRLTIQSVDDYDNPIEQAIVIKDPLTLKFSVDRSVFAEINGANIEIYNLSFDTYRQLFYDYYNVRKRTLILEAGYETTGYSIIFIGDVWSCYTSRNGTDVVTKIECLVGWKALSVQTDATLADISRNQILRYAANDMALDIQIYSGEDKKFNRSVSIAGNSYKTIQKYSDDSAFIDNNVIKVLNTNDAFEGDVILINDESGLLGVPEHEDALLTVKIMFEPRIMVGQVIEIQSRIAPMFNGQYKVFGIKHEGTISGSVSASASTTLECLVGSQVYGRFHIVKPQN